MGAKLFALNQGGEMPNSRDIQQDISATLLAAIGGEPVAGSGFETEEPESGFSTSDRVEE